MNNFCFFLTLWFLSGVAYGQNSEPRQDVRVRGGSDNTAIGNSTDSLKVTSLQSGAWTNTCLQGTSPWVTSAAQSGTWTVQQGSAPWSVSQSGTWTVGRTWTLSSGTDSVSVNNITGTVSLPTGAATEVSLAKLPVAQASTTLGQSGPLAQGAATTSSPSYSTGTTDPLSLTTAGALRTDASATTQPISAAALPLPAGASTSALQTSGNSTLSSIDTKTPALGQTTMAGSSPVVIASNQSAVPVSQSGSWTTGRTWTLSNGTDSIAAVESGTWSVRAQDGAGNALASSTTTPTGSEQALIVRNIPSGTQTISGTVTANQGTSPWLVSRNWTLSNGTDSIAAVQSGTWTVQQGSAPWSVSQSGTWTVQPGNTANTTAWYVKDDTQGSVAGGSAGTKSELSGGVYNSSPPTLTTGQQAALQLNSYGSLIVDDSTALGVPFINRTDVSTTVSASANSSTFESSGFINRDSTFNVTAISGTGASIQFHIEISDDATNWVRRTDTIKLTTTGSTLYRAFSQPTRYYRYTWTVLGTSPSVTFNIVTNLKQGTPSPKNRRFFYSDLDLTTNGNLSSVFDSGGCQNIAVLFMRGADGGNNGSIQLVGSIDAINWFSVSGTLAANVSSTNATSLQVTAFPYFSLETTAHTSAGTRVLDIQWSCN